MKLSYDKREASIIRTTNETNVEVKLCLDGSGDIDISTGIAFFDHMLNSLARHASFNLVVKAKGDLNVDDHHTIEDVGITIGGAIKKALGNKKGIERFGHAFVPMDEALASAVLDLSGRSYLVFNANFRDQRIGGFNPQNTLHFFESLTSNAGITAHLSVTGENDHHKIEALFKAFGIALKKAIKVSSSELLSTKGVL